MREQIEGLRVLALDVRPRICGYAAFEGGRLVDWGRVRCKPQVALIRRLTEVDRIVRPETVVLLQLHRKTRRNQMVTRAVAHIIRIFARHRGWAVAYVSEPALWTFFRKSGSSTKEQIAGALAERYPELKPKLPPPRKLWKPEDWRMPIFDAVALGTAFIARTSAVEQEPA